jgi:leucyl/phenylalanyl-tRNA--protein transferase
MEDLPPSEDLIANGADLDVATLLEAYRSGYFPMPMGARSLGWFSPDPRGILRPGQLRVSRSLRRSLSRYTVTVDAAFPRVIKACANPRRPHGWINRKITAAYTEMHKAGFAHSIETWDGDELVGGLYGINIGGLFAGESMFHTKTDASKVALVRLAELLQSFPEARATNCLVDVQWATPHLETLGVVAVDRNRYAELLRIALIEPGPDWNQTVR